MCVSGDGDNSGRALSEDRVLVLGDNGDAASPASLAPALVTRSALLHPPAVLHSGTQSGLG